VFRCQTCGLYVHADWTAADTNRTREYERALQILERTCDCSGEKMTMSRESPGDMYRK
jgi:hypothetical protein